MSIEKYTYNNLLDDLQRWNNSGLETAYIGSSLLGRMIPVIHIGSKTGKQILIQGAIHGREHITAKLTSAILDYTFLTKDKLNGGAYFIPMSNPDGVSLSQFGLDSVKDAGVRQFLLKTNGGIDFSLWKANAAAVDLNTNFPAKWGTGAQNVFLPAAENYVGKSAASEPETKALISFTKQVKPDMTISYHCKGHEIYWRFYQPEPYLSRDKKIADSFSELTGYALMDEKGSAGGYKDYCIQEFKIPAFTFETVSDNYTHPVDYAAFGSEFELNKNIVFQSLNMLI